MTLASIDLTHVTQGVADSSRKLLILNGLTSKTCGLGQMNWKHPYLNYNWLYNKKCKGRAAVSLLSAKFHLEKHLTLPAVYFRTHKEARKWKELFLNINDVHLM